MSRMTARPAFRRTPAFAAVALSAVVLLAACQPIQPMQESGAAPAAEATMPAAEATMPAAELPELTIELTADGIVAPAEVPAGPTVVNLVNSAGTTYEDGSPLMPEVGRLIDGATMDDLMAVLPEAIENPAPALELIKLFGSSFAGDGRVVWDLTPGSYVALTVEGEPMMTEFAVVESDAAAAMESDVQVELADFAFLMPDTVAAGPQTWEIANVGEQWHELVIVKLNEGVTVEDLFAFFETAGPEDAPPMEMIMGYAPFGEGNRVWVDVDLAPGEYTVLCFVPDLIGDMAPHAMHGMVRTLTVQ